MRKEFMKNPGFLTNGTIVVLKPKDTEKDINRVAVIVGRHTRMVVGFPEYTGLPIAFNPDEDPEKTLSYITLNSTMESFFSIFEDDIVSIVGCIDGIEKYEWVITHTINHIVNDPEREIVKLEETLEDALIEKNYTKFKWVINNVKQDQYTIKDWVQRLHTNPEFYMEYFDIKEKDVDYCIAKLEKQLD